MTGISFRNLEQLGLTNYDRKAIFDIYCQNSRGERFIVELQKAKQNYFKERTIYYSTFPIREQADKGHWDFNLKAVYCIGILDFTFDDYTSEAERGEYLHTVRLKDQHGRVFYDKLTYVYLEMPNFTKTEAELTTRLDKWLYFIQNLEDFESIPAIFQQQEVFEQAFETAALARFGPDDLDRYENSLKHYRDLKNVIDTAFDEGKLEGKLEGKRELARLMKADGEPPAKISRYTGLSEAEVAGL